MLHDLCWDDINEGTFQNPHSVLGAKWIIKLNLPTVSSFVSYIFLVAVQWSNLRGQRTHVCDKIKNPRQKATSKGLLIHSIGRQLGRHAFGPHWRKQNCQTCLAGDEEWCYFHTIHFFKYFYLLSCCFCLGYIHHVRKSKSTNTRLVIGYNTRTAGVHKKENALQAGQRK